MKQPPKHLDKTARAKWRELVGTLPDQEPGTLLALEQIVFAWAKWLSADDDDQRLRWSRCCRQWAGELKLTPKHRLSCRTKARLDEDPVSRLLRGGE